MDNAMQVKSDTLLILLANRIHSDLNIKQRSIKVSKCCKVVRDRTTDNTLYNACREVVKANSNGRYGEVLKAISLTEISYFLHY